MATRAELAAKAAEDVAEFEEFGADLVRAQRTLRHPVRLFSHLFAIPPVAGRRV